MRRMQGVTGPSGAAAGRPRRSSRTHGAATGLLGPSVPTCSPGYVGEEPFEPRGKRIASPVIFRTDTGSRRGRRGRRGLHGLLVAAPPITQVRRRPLFTGHPEPANKPLPRTRWLDLLLLWRTHRVRTIMLDAWPRRRRIDIGAARGRGAACHRYSPMAKGPEMATATTARVNLFPCMGFPTRNCWRVNDPVIRVCRAGCWAAVV